VRALLIAVVMSWHLIFVLGGLDRGATISCTMTAMQTAGVAYKDCLLLYHVAALPVGNAWVDSMFVVETPADGVAFNNLVTHCGAVQICAERGE
jgi:hypothetical protein